jgi:predicted GH43/DUF377 family glycosyl hydrolase
VNASRRTGVLLRPDPSRVVAKIFLPGQEPTTIGLSRAAGVVTRCLAMSAQETGSVLEEILTSFGSRHRDFARRLEVNFEAVAHRVEGAEGLSPARRQLIGAYFTQEYAIEAAALFNPSIVVHPQQDLGPGRLRFVMSARAVGEGHVSSIVFRTGVLSDGPGASATVSLDPPSPYVTTGTPVPSAVHRERFWREADDAGVDPETLAFVLNLVPERFTSAQLDRALEALHEEQLTRVNSDHTAATLRAIAGGSYEVGFAPETELSERALMPIAPVESHGMEDARFVRFVDGDGSVSYLATYTAFDGAHIASRRLQTDDFRTFIAVTFTGRVAANKGLALFPRRVAGRYLALSRWDRENNTIVSSFDGYHWQDTTRLQTPHQPWELIQLGNCGSPIETPQGWLVLTHGVGAMRRYSIGALLLDLDDPSLVRGRLAEPLLRPAEDERDGYVPNVVYSCGALVHHDTLVLPYGCSDSTIRFALVDLPGLLGRLLEPSATGRRGMTT